MFSPRNAASPSLKTACWKNFTSSARAQDNYVGNIYKGRIVNLEPSIQAAFVDFGVGRNGFFGTSATWSLNTSAEGGYDPKRCLWGGFRNSDIDTGEDEEEDGGEGQGAPAARAATATVVAVPPSRTTSH